MKLQDILSYHRLAPILAPATTVEKFILIATLRGADEEDVDEILDAMFPAGPDFSAVVVGKPLHHWIGKNRAQLTRELTDQQNNGADIENVDASVDEIFSEIEKRTGTNPDTVAPDADHGDTFDRRGTNPGVDSLRPQDPARLLGGRKAPTATDPDKTDPTFGKDQIPASELFTKTDAELLAIDGIGPAAVKRIRAMQADRGIDVPAPALVVDPDADPDTDPESNTDGTPKA